jgi:transcriptional regulator with XRE-family HTH domain
VLWLSESGAATVRGVSVCTPSHGQLGSAVRRLRRARRLTIETLADAAEMHPTYLSGIERGQRNPTWTKLCGLARALDVPVSAIVETAEAQPADSGRGGALAQHGGHHAGVIPERGVS